MSRVVLHHISHKSKGFLHGITALTATAIMVVAMTMIVMMVVMMVVIVMIVVMAMTVAVVVMIANHLYFLLLIFLAQFLCKGV
jgi:hypothetical protein